MAIVVESVGQSSGAFSTDCVITKPASTQVGDLLIACTVWAAGAITVTPPSGWTSIRQTDFSSSSPTIATFYKVATSTETAAADFTFTGSSSVSNIGGMLRLSGAGAVSYDVEASGTDASVSLTPSSMGAHDLYVVVGGSDFPNAWTTPSGTTERLDINTSLGADTSILIATGTAPSFTSITRDDATDAMAAHGFFVDDAITGSSSVSPSVSPSASVSPSSSLSPSVSPSLSPSASVSPSLSPSASLSPSSSSSPSVSPSSSISPSSSVSPSLSPSASVSPSPSLSPSSSTSPSVSPSASLSPSASVSPSPSVSPSLSPSASLSPSSSVSPSPSISPSYSPSASISPSSSVSASPSPPPWTHVSKSSSLWTPAPLTRSSTSWTNDAK